MTITFHFDVDEEVHIAPIDMTGTVTEVAYDGRNHLFTVRYFIAGKPEYACFRYKDLDKKKEKGAALQ